MMKRPAAATAIVMKFDAIPSETSTKGQVQLMEVPGFGIDDWASSTMDLSELKPAVYQFQARDHDGRWQVIDASFVRDASVRELSHLERFRGAPPQ